MRWYSKFHLRNEYRAITLCWTWRTVIELNYGSCLELCYQDPTRMYGVTIYRLFIGVALV